MSDPPAPEKGILSSSGETEGLLTLQKSPDSIRAFFYRLRSKLRPQSLSNNKTHESSLNRKGLAVPIVSQQDSSKKATASRQPGLGDKNAPDSGKSAASKYQHNHNHSHNHKLGRKNSLSCPPSQFPSPHSSCERIEEEPNETDERERTLRILESGDKSVVRRSCSPATVRRRRRSYQLAADPHIEPQQYSDFLRYLEREITTDAALRLQIWKSLTGDSGNRVMSLLDLDQTVKLPISEDVYCTTTRRARRLVPSSHGKPHKLGGASCTLPTTCTNSISIGFSTGLQDRKLKGRNWNSRQAGSQRLNSILEEEKESSRAHDYPSRTLPIGSSDILVNGPRKSAINPGPQHPQCTDPSGKAALQQSNVRQRQSWPQESIPTDKCADKKRDSTSGLTHVIAQYIRPEMPRTVNRRPRCRSYEIPLPGHKDISA